MELVVARLGRPRGVRGEVWLDVRTDSPADRLRPGARFTRAGNGIGHLTLTSVHRHPGGWSARFAEIADRDQAEAARGAELLVDAAHSDEPDAWYPHELRGLAAVLPDGTPAGQVAGLVPAPAQDLLEIREPTGAIAWVPFVRELVPVVDIPGGRIIVDPPPGLLAARPADPDDDAPPAAANAPVGEGGMDDDVPSVGADVPVGGGDPDDDVPPVSTDAPAGESAGLPEGAPG